MKKELRPLCVPPLCPNLGSVRDVIDSNGDLRIHRVFDAFGNVVDETHYNTSGTEVTSGQTGYVDEAFAFTGRWFDPDTNLQNNLNRWYDPAVGRWLSEDPLPLLASDANPYRYVGNMPVIMVDPRCRSRKCLTRMAHSPWFQRNSAQNSP